jgi:hypothetical protein
MREQQGSVKPLADVVQSHDGSPISREALVRLLGPAPMTLFLPGLPTVPGERSAWPSSTNDAKEQDG